MNRLEPLDHRHNRKSFDCGVAPLNVYLQQTARQHSERDISRVFVLVSQDDLEPKQVLGYFSLAACDADKSDLPEEIARKLPREFPAARLGRLAEQKEKQGLGFGKDLVIAAMVKTAEAARFVGITGLFVDAKDDSAAKFYQQFGFLPLPNQPLTLFLPIQTLREIVSSAGYRG
jgi:GNAT superfamily N-acetyltransferase